MTQAEIYKYFKEFLILNHCYDEYMENYCKRQNAQDFKVWANQLIYTHNLKDLIAGAFPWRVTISGQDFWYKINNLWLIKVNEIITKKGIKNAYKVEQN